MLTIGAGVLLSLQIAGATLQPLPPNDDDPAERSAPCCCPPALLRRWALLQGAVKKTPLKKCLSLVISGFSCSLTGWVSPRLGRGQLPSHHPHALLPWTVAPHLTLALDSLGQARQAAARLFCKEELPVSSYLFKVTSHNFACRGFLRERLCHPLLSLHLLSWDPRTSACLFVPGPSFSRRNGHHRTSCWSCPVCWRGQTHIPASGITPTIYLCKGRGRCVG